MVDQHRLDLGRVDVLATGDDHVLHAVLQEQVTLLVEDAEVARVEPAAVGDRLRGGVEPVPVALHHVGALDDDLADLARLHILHPVVDHPHLGEHRWQAGGADLAQRVLLGQQGRERRGLGEAVALHERYAAFLVEADEGLRHRGAPADERAHRRQVAICEARHLAHEEEHGGDTEHRRDVVLLDEVEHLHRIERPQEHHGAPLEQRDERGHVEPTDVEEGGAHEGDVVLERVEGQRGVDVVPQDVAVGEHGALGPPRRARGVHDDGHLVGVHLVVDRQRGCAGDHVVVNEPVAAL